jgi:hypothetical protein
MTALNARRVAAHPLAIATGRGMTIRIPPR